MSKAVEIANKVLDQMEVEQILNELFFGIDPDHYEREFISMLKRNVKDLRLARWGTPLYDESLQEAVRLRNQCKRIGWDYNDMLTKACASLDIEQKS